MELTRKFKVNFTKLQEKNPDVLQDLSSFINKTCSQKLSNEFRLKISFVIIYHKRSNVCQADFLKLIKLHFVKSNNNGKYVTT